MTAECAGWPMLATAISLLVDGGSTLSSRDMRSALEAQAVPPASH